MSITQSLAATTRMSCSTTTTVFPAATNVSSCANQFVDVGSVQAGGWLVQNIQGGSALDPLQLCRELDSLRLAAG